MPSTKLSCLLPTLENALLFHKNVFPERYPDGLT